MPPIYHLVAQYCASNPNPLTRSATVSSLNTDDTFFFEGNLHPERYGGYTDEEDEDEGEESYYPASRSGTRTPTTHSRPTRSPSVVPRLVPSREATPSTWSVVGMSDAGYATDVSSSTVTSGLAKFTSASASATSGQRAPNTRESTPSLWSNVDPSDVGYATDLSSSTIAPRSKSTSTRTRTPSRFSTPVHERHQPLTTSPMSQIRRSASVLTIDDDAQSVTSVDEPVNWDRVYADKQHRLAMESHYLTRRSVLQPSDSRADLNPEHRAYHHHRTPRAPTVLSLKDDDQTDCASYGPDLRLDIKNLYHANQSPALQAACLSKSPPSVRSAGGNLPSHLGSVLGESDVESSNATITNPHTLAFCTYQDLNNMRKGDSPSTSGGRASTTAIYDLSRSPSGRTLNSLTRTPRRTQRTHSSRDFSEPDWDAKSIASQVQPDSDNRVKCPWCSKTYPSMPRTRLAEHLTSKHGSAFRQGALNHNFN